MAHVQIDEVVSTVRVVDRESLLSGPVLERLVAAVLEAAGRERQDDLSRRRDIRLDAGGDDEGEGDRR
jgi:hypothetical protein